MHVYTHGTLDFRDWSTYILKSTDIIKVILFRDIWGNVEDGRISPPSTKIRVSPQKGSLAWVIRDIPHAPNPIAYCIE